MNVIGTHFWNFEMMARKKIVHTRKKMAELYLRMMAPQQQIYNLNQKNFT